MTATTRKAARPKRPPESDIRIQLRSLVESQDIVGYVDRSMEEAMKRLPGLDDASNRIALMIFRLSDLISYDHETAVLRPLGLSSAGFHLLWVIWLTSPLEGSAVAHLMGASRANVSGISATLVKDGLLMKIPSPSDGRSTLLALTPEGKRRLEEAWLAISDRSRSVLGGMTATELSTLTELLGKLAGLAVGQLQQRF
jgi:DNA-binding MarR family transcriptional regulator